MEQSELLAGPLSLHPCLKSLLSLPSSEYIVQRQDQTWQLLIPSQTRPTEHVNNFGISILIVQILEKPTQVTGLLSEQQLLCSLLKIKLNEAEYLNHTSQGITKCCIKVIIDALAATNLFLVLKDH